MNKFLSSFTNSVSKEEVLQIIEDTSVTYNEDKSVSINDSKNTTIYTLPTPAGVPGNNVVVGPDGNTLIFANSGGGGVQNPMTSNLNCNNFFVTILPTLTSWAFQISALSNSYISNTANFFHSIWLNFNTYKE